MPRARKMPVQGTVYGEEAALARAQEAVPAMPAPGGPVPTAPVPFIGPDQVPNLADPTRRPDEPVTAGAPFGPGPGPSPFTPTEDPVRDTLRAMYLVTKSPHVRRMMQQMGM